jgi:hypothetical protein
MISSLLMERHFCPSNHCYAAKTRIGVNDQKPLIILLPILARLACRKHGQKYFRDGGA